MKIAIDENTADIYIVYTARTTAADVNTASIDRKSTMV